MYCHHFNRDYKIKNLISLISPMWNNHQLLVDFNLSSFVRRVTPMVPSSPLDNFPFLKEDNKEKHKLFRRDKCISKIYNYCQGKKQPNLV